MFLLGVLGGGVLVGCFLVWAFGLGLVLFWGFFLSLAKFYLGVLDLQRSFPTSAIPGFHEILQEVEKLRREKKKWLGKKHFILPAYILYCRKKKKKSDILKMI